MSGKPGRPRIVDTPQEFEARAGEYFAELEKENLERIEAGVRPRPPTIAGIALHLGFSSRQSFYDYENEAGFSDTVKKARFRIEQHHEERMSGNSPTGSIFWLKNHDWSDRQELEHSGPGGGPIETTVTDAREKLERQLTNVRNRIEPHVPAENGSGE